MNGPEHYHEAEALIEAIDAMRDNLAADIPWHEVHASSALAQVHATLALAAAQVEDMESTELRAGWAEIVEGDGS